MTALIQILLAGILAFAVSVGLTAILAVPAMFLWNGILPEVFGITSVGYLQMWGLMLLASLLFHQSSVGLNSDS